MKHTTRRLAALAAAPLLAGVLVAPQAAQAAPERTPQAHAAAQWLTDQLDGGIVSYETGFGVYPDPGLSIDALLSLASLGGYANDVQDIADGVAASVGDYTGLSTEGEAYSGAIAKAAVAAQTAGRDPRSFGGQDLIAQLEGLVQTSEGSEGRVKDKSQYGDYANLFSQAFAAQALDTAGSSQAGSVTQYLVGQQCPAGYFRLALASSTATCGADDANAPDTDATAQAVLSLSQQSDDTDVAAALDKAEGWLLGQQGTDGSFGGGTSTEASNTNSTAIAALALDRAGDSGAAAKAAAWIAGRQVTTTQGCGTDLVYDRGAVAYDDATFTAGRSAGITDDTFGKWFRSTAPAVAALGLYTAPAPAPATTLSVTRGTTGYVQASSTLDVTVSGLTAGEDVCVTSYFSPGAQANDEGVATLPFKVRSSTGTQTVVVTGSRAARTGQLVLKVLAAKRLTTNVRSARIKVGATQRYAIRGLAAGEKVTLTLDGRRIRTATARADGVLAGSFTSRGVGKHTLKAVGQFSNRYGSTSFTVTR